jgi:hypothetical protein
LRSTATRAVTGREVSRSTAATSSFVCSTTRPLASAKDFAERRAAELAARPVWLFSSGPIGDPPKPVEDPADVGPLLAATGAREHRVFAGRLERARCTSPSARCAEGRAPVRGLWSRTGGHHRPCRTRPRNGRVRSSA